MKIYFDSSVLVNGLLQSQSDHLRAAQSLDRVARGEIRGVVSAHGLAETWSALTGTPMQPRPGSAQVRDLIREGILRHFSVVEASRADYESVLDAAAENDSRGGSVYDALHAAMARKCRADVLLTFDTRDFLRVAPDLASRIRTP